MIRQPRIIAFAALALMACALQATTAHAATRHRHHRVPPFRVTQQVVSDHTVTMTTYMPGRRVQLRATYGTRRSPLGWGTAVGAFATMNADTWAWATNIPEGPTRVNGRWINRPAHPWSNLWDRPAVGFYSTGGIVFGATAAALHGAANIVSGPAYLIRGGVVQHTFPWAHTVQITCGPHGTDGAGCFRSCIVKFRGGRVGMVEIGFASMPVAANILHRLNVVEALTFDSGGSAVMGWHAHHRRIGPWNRAGIQHAIGSTWLRPVPEAIELVPR